MPRFAKPKWQGDGVESPNLFVANCGPAVGVKYESIASVFGSYGNVSGVYPADESGCRVIVSFADSQQATAAMNALQGHPCPSLGDRSLHIRPSVIVTSSKIPNSITVATTASDLEIPGLQLVLEFVNPSEEQSLISAVDSNPWTSLSKRRIQHYGYEFKYNTRNVDTNEQIGELPSFVSPIIERIRSSSLHDPSCSSLDQLTVNEYPPGVGLSPHIDTHSAFGGSIYSLSLGGPCVMEFRRYSCSLAMKSGGKDEESSDFARKALFLPPRSMLLLSGEARYAWHHYIPHHKIDKLNDCDIRRAARRISFTFRKVLTGPCQCEFDQFCDLNVKS